MPSNNNKRKAEDIVDPSDGSGGDSDGPPTKKKTQVASTDHDDGPLQLPAVVWGHVLDFMPYGEVRSALLICKTVANDAVDHVQTINVMKSTQLNVPAARRFLNVRELNILCLLKSADSSTNMLSCELCPDTVGRAVFFAASFPKVERILVGGYNFVLNAFWGSPQVCYNPQNCVAPQNHQDIFDTLVKGFCGALKTGLFPQVTSIDGIIEHNGCCALVDGVRVPEVACDCQDICRFFPMENVMNRSRIHCLDVSSFFDIVGERNRGLTNFRSNAFEIITMAIEERLSVYEESDLVRDGGEHATAFVQTTADTLSKLPYWEDDEYPSEFFHDLIRIFFLSDVVFAKIDMLLARSAFDPRECTGKEKFMFPHIWDTLEPRILAKSTYDGLMSRGFPIDGESIRDRLVVVDDSKQPALRGLAERIREG